MIPIADPDPPSDPRRGRKPVPEVQIRNQEIVERYRAGSRPRQIAREFKISRSRVQQILRQFGCIPERPLTDRDRLDEDLRVLWDTDLSLSQVATRLGRSSTYVLRRAAEMNLGKRTSRRDRGADELRRRWYANESAYEIALALNTTPNTVGKWARQLNLPPRSLGSVLRRLANRRHGRLIPEEMIPDLTIRWNRGDHASAIGRSLGISVPTVYNWARRLNLPARPELDQLPEALLANRDELTRRWAARETGKQIAEALHVSVPTIYNWARQLNLPVRSRAEIVSQAVSPRIDEFRRRWDAGESYYTISVALNMTQAAVGYWRRRLQLPGRQRRCSTTSGEERRKQSLPDARQQELREYWAHNASVSFIAQQLGISQTTVYRWVRRMQLESRRASSDAAE